MSAKSLLILSAASMLGTAAGAATEAYVSVWGETTSCTDDAADTEVVATINGCTEFSGGGITLYATVTGCAAENGAWSMTVHTDSACTAVPVGVLSGTDACDCAAVSIVGNDVTARVSCQHNANQCYFMNQWEDSKCDLDDTPVATGSHISGTCVSTGAGYVKVTCDGGTAKSSWDGMWYSDATCTTGVGTALEGKSCGTCAMIDSDDDSYGSDFYSMEDAALQVNCAGYDWEEAGGCKDSAASASATAAVAVTGVLAAAAGFFM